MTVLAPPVDASPSSDRSAFVALGGRPRSVRARVMRWMRAHPVAVAISSSALLAWTVVFVRWFHTGEYYARGDLAPFVRDSLRAELGRQWTHQTSGAGGPTYELVRIIDLLFSDIAHIVGGSDALGERLLFSAIFAFTAAGVAVLAARFVKRPWLIAITGVLGAFAPLTMVNLPNYLVPLCIGLASWFTALTIDAARDGIGRSRRLAVISTAIAYLALNPPLLVMLAAWIALLPVVAAAVTGTGRIGAKRALWFLVRTAAWAVPLGLWWIVPYLFAVGSAANSGTINANTNVFSWSWTHAHGSFDRVLSMVAKWSWPDPKFAANASNMARPATLWLAVVVPMACFCAPLVARRERRRAALWLVLGLCVFAFVAKGLNAPFRFLNSLLYHLPGSWLLREPMSKIGPLMVPLLLLGWALTTDGIAAQKRTLSTRVAIATLVVAPIVFAIPMLSGSVVRAQDRVRIPAAWRQVGRIVDDAPLSGKALVLPLDDFYQVPTTWGYYGADSVPVQMIRRPTIVRNPQAYISGGAGFDDLVRAVQTGIIGGDPSATSGALHALGVSYLVVRKDIDHLSPVRAVDMPEGDEINAGLVNVPGMRRIASTGVADIFEFSQGAPPVEALGGTIAAPGAHGAALATLVASTPSRTAIATTDPGDAPLLRGQSWFVDVNNAGTIHAPQSGDWTYQRRAAGAPLLELQPDASGLLLHEPVAVSIGGTPLATRADVNVRGDGAAVAADVDQQLYDLTHGPVYVRVQPGATVSTFSLGPAQTVAPWSSVGDCNHYDNNPQGLHSQIDTTITLHATRHSACIWAPVTQVVPSNVVRVTLDQRSVRGSPPRTCLWQNVVQNCAPLTWSATRHGDWYSLAALYRVPARVTQLKLFLYADEPAAHTASSTETQYRNVQIDTLRSGSIRIVEPAPLPHGQIHLDGEAVAVSTSFDVPKPLLGNAAPAGDCAHTDSRSLKQLGIAMQRLTPDPNGVRLSAQRHNACTALPAFGLEPAITYELSFDARVVEGTGPKICIWEDTLQKCAKFSQVHTPTNGTGPYRYRGRLDPNASGVRLYLYADATSTPTTIEYHVLQLRPITDESLVLHPVSVAPTPAPSVTWNQFGSNKYRVHVDDAQGPFVLALTDAYSRSWGVRGLPAGARVEPVQIDGYRNGWMIDARGPLDLTLAYSPARMGSDALHVSEVTLVVLFASVAFGPSFTRRVRRFRAGRARRRQPGPRRIALPSTWPIVLE